MRLWLRDSSRIFVGFTLCIVAVLALVAYSTPALAAAGINQQLNFQGRLLNAQGATVPDGNYNIQFKIYQDGDGLSAGNTTGSPAGSLKWTESHLNNNSQGVQVKNGFLSVQLGSITAFGSSIDWNQDKLWISMNVGNTNGSCTPFTSCSGDGEMLPMKRLSSTPYALNSGQLGGLTSAQFLQLAQGVQTDASTNTTSVFINKTSTGNFVQLQASTVDVFTISNAGDVTFGNNANHTISVTTSAASTVGRQLSISAGTGGSGTGSAGGTLVLQGGAAGGTNANGGDVTINAGAKTGSGTDGAISFGTSNTSAINLNQNTTVAAGKSLTVVGGNTASRPGSPTEGMIYFDSTTKQLLTYANGKWQADRTEAVIVAASNSSQADKDAADYVGDGNTGTAADGDQVQINAALTAASGKKVILLAGTYVADATILIPNNTTLVGVGNGTVVELADLDATDNLIENTDQTTGVGVSVRDLKLNGRKDLNSAGTQQGIYFNNLGAGSGPGELTGAYVNNVVSDNFRDVAIYLNNSPNSTISNSFALNSVTGFGIGGTNTDNVTLTGSLAQGNTNGIYLLTAENVTISSNVTRTNTYNLIIDNSYFNTVTGNTFRTGSTNGVSLRLGARHNTVTGNTFHDNGGTTNNNAIHLSAADNNMISSNIINDSSATTTNYAINISDSTSDTNYLSDNTLNGGSINDAGTGTVYGGQVNGSSNYLVQPAGTVELMQDTNITGALTASSTIQGTRFISTVSTGTAPLTVASTTLVTNLNADLLDGLSSAAFATATGASGYIQNQNAGVQSASNFWLSGTGRADTSITTPLLDTATAVALDIGTTNATVINLNENVSIATGKTLTVVGTGLTSLGGALTVTGLSSTNGGLGVNKTLSVNGGTQNVQTITFATAADSSGTNIASGLNITPTIGNATAGTNTANVINIGAVTGDPQVALNALNIGALTTGNANDAALNIGTGWGNILRYNGTSLINSTGILQNAAVSGSYTGITGTGALTAGSIASGFGIITTGNTITGTTLNGTTGINTGASAGTQRIDSNGNLVNIGTITSGLINGQTISSTANFTGTVTVATSITAPILQSAAATALTVDSGTTGQLNLGTTASAKTIQIGTTTGAVAQTINIGTNNTASSTTNVTIGSGGSATSGTTTVQAKTSITIATNGVTRGTFDNANNLYLGNGVTAAAPSSFTLSGTGSSTTGVAGAALTVQGGAATVGNANGGNLSLTGGAGIGTGSNGLVVIATPTFSTTANDANCYTGGALVAVSCTIATSSVNNSSAVIVGFNTATQTATLPDPSILTAGRIVYVTAANSSVDFTLSVNGGGTGNQIAMRQNTSATMIWNGADWTAAGASSSTTLQSAYDNTLQSAGGAELVVSKTASTNGLTIRDSATNPVNGTLLSVQSASAASLFSVNSDVKEYTSNGGAETTGGTSTTFPANTWTALASSTVTRHATAGNYIATGQGSASVVSTAVANTGVKNQMNSTLTANTTYNVSFTTRLLSGTFTDMNVYYSIDGSAASVLCATGATTATSVWTKVNCTFTTPASGITSSNAIFIRQTAATARTFYVDNLSVTIAADYNFATDGNVSDGANFATNWNYTTGVGTGVVTRNTSDGFNASDSAQVAISAGATNAGLRNKLGSNPLPDTLYRLTVYAKLASGTFTDFKMRYSPNNGSSHTDCVDYNTQTVTTSGWTKITCYVTTPATAVTAPYIYFAEGSAVARTFMVDAFSMTLRTSTTPNVQIGGGVNGGPTTLLTLDKGASAPIASDNDALLGSMYYDTTLGKLQCYESDGWGACGSSPDNVVTISPEYTNAVMHGTGIGTMTSDLCSDTLNINDGSSSQPTICGTNETYNFYKWTSPQASAQTYGIYVTYQLPSTFKEFASGQTTLMGRTDSANSTVNYQIYRSNATGLTACGSAVAVSTGVQTSWQTGTASGAADPSTCSFAPGNSIVFKISTTASNTANAYVGNLNFTFSNR